MQLHTAGLIVIKNRKVLLAYSNNKKAYYLPGGKVDAGETSLQALQREIAEELNINLPADDLQYYMHITAPAFGENGLIMEQDCFLYEMLHEPQPSAEIGAVEYFDAVSYALEPEQVPGVRILIERLQQDDLLD
ncbi:MAG: NUDIX domain-containing protein [Chitinophagaceae bacterium]